jgi:hypothetical protein
VHGYSLSAQVKEIPPLAHMGEPRSQEPYLGLTTDMVENHLRNELGDGATTTFLSTFAGRHSRLLPAPHPIHADAGPESITDDILRSALRTDGVRGAIDVVCLAGRARGRVPVDALNYSVSCTGNSSLESPMTSLTELPPDLKLVPVFKYLELLACALPHAACEDVARAFGVDSAAVGLMCISDEDVSAVGTCQGTIYPSPDARLDRNDRGRELAHRRSQLRRRCEGRAGRIIMDSSQSVTEGEVEFNLLHRQWRRTEVQLRREIALDVLMTSFLWLPTPFPGSESAELRRSWVEEHFPFRVETVSLFERDSDVFHTVSKAYADTGKGSLMMSPANLRLRSGIYFSALADAEAFDDDSSSADDTLEDEGDKENSERGPDDSNDLLL